MSKKALIASTLLNRVSVPESVDFDGANDYVSWASDLTGNADGKAATFSVFVYWASVGSAGYIYASEDATNLRSEFFVSSGTFGARVRNASGTIIMEVSVPIPIDTFTNVQLSFDLTNPSNRSVYVNDIATSPTWSTYTNDTIDWTIGEHFVGSRRSLTFPLKGRLAHVFLKQSYYDLSIEANRRLFIDADGLPVDASGLSPILYMKMTDAASVAVNSGTGGDGTLNGVVATSGRGANQYNSPASTFDGSADYLSSTSVTGLTAGKVASVSFWVKFEDLTSGDTYLMTNSNRFSVYWDQGAGVLTVNGLNSGFATVLDMDTTVNPFVTNKLHHVHVYFDLTNASNRGIIVDGVDVTGTVATYTNDNINFTSTAFTIGASSSPSLYLNGVMSDVYFTTSYVSDNALFFDTDTGKPKYLGSQGELPTGSQPLIYLPLRGDDAGNNLGSGGDFTVNSGPYTGARGPSENWEQAISVDGTNYLTKAGGIFCQSLVKWKSVDSGVTWTATYANAVTVTDIGNGTDNGYVAYYFGTSENITWNEENQLRFTDAFGYPLPMPIDANTVLALDFSNPANRGENLGTGGDYTVTGTPVDVGSLKG